MIFRPSLKTPLLIRLASLALFFASLRPNVRLGIPSSFSSHCFGSFTFCCQIFNASFRSKINGYILGKVLRGVLTQLAIVDAPATVMGAGLR